MFRKIKRFMWRRDNKNLENPTPQKYMLCAHIPTTVNPSAAFFGRVVIGV